MMRLGLASVLLFFSISSIAAAERKADTLTPEEIAAGWLLLFDGESKFGWEMEGRGKVADGIMLLGASEPTRAVCTSLFNSFELRMETAKSVGGGRLVLDSGKGVLSYAITDKPHLIDLTVQFNPMGLGAKQPIGEDSGDRVTLQNVGWQYTGRVAIRLEVPAMQTLAVRSIRIRPLGLQPLFNGKDLTGWKEFPNRKSRFSVNEKGELNVQDGPGDLQTDGLWDDFVLQLDGISHGKHLNSGIFFRCLPGQYQQGYEAQIRNQWEGDDRTKPVDFGTGAIYRRQAARRVVSSDNEWFRMTVMARGSRLGVWVNGYQVADFVDERPSHENARNGSKMGKGAISIHGHDPTTNLSFRNIRLAALPKPAEKP